MWQPDNQNRTEQFENELLKIIPDYRIADEFIAGAEWVLARNPYLGTQLSFSDVWHFPMEDFPELPQLSLLYTFNAEKVFFLSLIVTARPFPDDADFQFE